MTGFAKNQKNDDRVTTLRRVPKAVPNTMLVMAAKVIAIAEVPRLHFWAARCGPESRSTQLVCGNPEGRTETADSASVEGPTALPA